MTRLTILIRIKRKRTLTFPEFSTKESLVKEKACEIVYVFGSLLSEIERLCKETDYKFNHDLIDNILISGLKKQTKQILEGEKCKNTTKF